MIPSKKSNKTRRTPLDILSYARTLSTGALAANHYQRHVTELYLGCGNPRNLQSTFAVPVAIGSQTLDDLITTVDGAAQTQNKTTSHKEPHSNNSNNYNYNHTPSNPITHSHCIRWNGKMKRGLRVVLLTA